MTTGQLAQACEVSADTIRYYERQGVISALRDPNGYRSFSVEMVQRVGVIRRAMAVGFSLAEVAGFLREREGGRPPCRKVRAAAESRLAEIDRRIDDLVALRDQLAKIVDDWDARLARITEGQPAHLLETLPERTSS